MALGKGFEVLELAKDERLHIMARHRSRGLSGEGHVFPHRLPQRTHAGVEFRVILHCNSIEEEDVLS